jgi:hypothetical protein
MYVIRAKQSDSTENSNKFSNLGKVLRFGHSLGLWVLGCIYWTVGVSWRMRHCIHGRRPHVDVFHQQAAVMSVESVPRQ